MTHVVRPLQLNPNVSADDLLYMVNQLPVNLLDFAHISCMENRVYAVKTLCDPECWEHTWLNQCARNNVWRLLISIQQNLLANERMVMSPMYLYEDIPWYPGKVVKLKFPNIDVLNVRSVYTNVGSVSISPFVQLNVPLQASVGFIEALVEQEVVHNSNQIYFREPGTAGGSAPIYANRPTQPQNGYPYSDAGDWIYAMGNSVNSDAITLHAQDCNYTFVDITPVVGQTIGDIVFMFPHQNQIVPQALPPEIVGGNWRFWFYYWTLKRAEFSDEQSDLSEWRDFDHFYDELRYGYMEETTEPAVISLADDGCCDDDPDADRTALALASAVNSELGIVRFQQVREVEPVTDPPTYRVVCDGCTPALCCHGVPYTVRVYYKVKPQSTLLVEGIEEVRRAIVAKVAANIPMEACNCKNKDNSYVSEMQEDVPTVYANIAGPISVYKYGHRVGDLAFQHILNNVSRKRRLVVV